MATKQITNEVADTDWLSTGCTLLNLAISGHPDRGFAKGKYFWLVGDSSSGKTFLLLTCFAEAAINKNFDNYDLVFDNAEDGALMDMTKFFGSAMAKRIQPPAWKGSGKNKVPVNSEIIEDLYFNLDDRLKAVEAGTGKPFIYLLDSMDALSSKYEGKKFNEAKTERRGGAKAKGDFGDGKAKMNSKYMRGIVQRLRPAGCILVVLSQTRDNIDAGMFEPQQTHAGGRSLKFYATVQLWSSLGKKLTKTRKGKKIQTGITCRVAVKKNRMSGKEWTVDFPIYHSTGIDDIGGCIDFLVSAGDWTKNDQGVIDGTADLTDCKGKKEPLIKWIQENDLDAEIREITTEAWADIEKATKVNRRNKYAVE